MFFYQPAPSRPGSALAGAAGAGLGFDRRGASRLRDRRLARRAAELAAAGDRPCRRCVLDRAGHDHRSHRACALRCRLGLCALPAPRRRAGLTRRSGGGRSCPRELSELPPIPRSAKPWPGCASASRASIGAGSTARGAIRASSSTRSPRPASSPALIPEEYGGAGLPLSAAAAILEEIQRAGCNGAACHAQMYIMGTVLRHGSREQKERYLPEIAAGRTAPAGLRRHRADQRHRHDGAQDDRAAAKATHYIVNGQKIWTSRAEHSDLMLLLARTTPRDQVEEAHRGAVGLPRRHARGAAATA